MEFSQRGSGAEAGTRPLRQQHRLKVGWAGSPLSAEPNFKAAFFYVADRKGSWGAQPVTTRVRMCVKPY
ncbi:hypothetical protein P3T16_003389 [Paraburkholderia sp. GAS42]